MYEHGRGIGERSKGRSQKSKLSSHTQKADDWTRRDVGVSNNPTKSHNFNRFSRFASRSHLSALAKRLTHTLASLALHVHKLTPNWGTHSRYTLREVTHSETHATQMYWSSVADGRAAGFLLAPAARPTRRGGCAFGAVKEGLGGWSGDSGTSGASSQKPPTGFLPAVAARPIRRGG